MRRTAAIGLVVGLSWAVLGLASAPALAQGLAQGDVSELPALISADQITYDKNLEVVTASGHVEISQNERVLLADTISYSLRTEVVTASGNISLLEPSGEILFADYVEMTGDLREGFVRDIRILLTDRSRMAATDATRVGGNRTVMRNAVFSPCELCPEDPTRAPLWQIKAQRVIHDQNEKTISYENAWMEFFGVPVAYTPYFEHPDPTVKRKSGFLAPTVGSSDVLGATLQVPYFWAIGPEKDLTVAPIITSNEGVVLTGEYRHLLPDGELRLAGSGTIADRANDNGTVDEDVVRGHIDSEGRFDINETWRWGFDLNRATDRTYLRRYNLGGNDRTLTSDAFVEGFRGRNYMAVNNFLYQGLRRSDNNDQAPLILPMLDYNYVSEPGVAGGTYRLDADVLVLNRFEGRESRRVSVRGGWELPYTSPLGDVYSLGAYIQTDGYWVEGFDDDQPDVVNPINAEEGLAGRVFPELVLGWRYPWVSHQDGFSQVVEPIAQVVAAPQGFNPGGIPNEDSLDFEFDDTNLFSLSRFPGRDRVDSGTRFDYGIDWTLLTEHYGVSNIFVGQSYQIDPNDNFGVGSGLDDNFSDYVGRVRIQPVDFVDLVYRFRLDKDELTPNRSELDARLGPPALNVQASYLDLTDESDQLELASREELYLRLNSRLSEYWSAHIAHRRDLREDASLVSQVGVTYQDECFLVEAIAQRTFFSDSDVEPDDSVFLRFVFKHLGEFGTS